MADGIGRSFVMEAFFEFLKTNPFMLLFLTVALSVWVGRFTIKG